MQKTKQNKKTHKKTMHCKCRPFDHRWNTWNAYSHVNGVKNPLGSVDRHAFEFFHRRVRRIFCRRRLSLFPSSVQPTLSKWFHHIQTPDNHWESAVIWVSHSSV